MGEVNRSVLNEQMKSGDDAAVEEQQEQDKAERFDAAELLGQLRG